MSEEANLLRLLVQGDKEFKVTQVDVTEVATAFTSQLTSQYSRKGIAIYNNSDSASGEIFLGGSDLTAANGFPIPKGTAISFPIASNLSIYLISESGELGDARVIEFA